MIWFGFFPTRWPVGHPGIPGKAIRRHGRETRAKRNIYTKAVNRRPVAGPARGRAALLIPPSPNHASTHFTLYRAARRQVLIGSVYPQSCECFTADARALTFLLRDSYESFRGVRKDLIHVCCLRTVALLLVS